MRARLLLSLALVSAADAVYVALSRPLVGVDAFGVGALVLLATAESLAFIPAFAAASLSEVLGGRRVALLAVAAAPGVLALLPLRELPAEAPRIERIVADHRPGLAERAEPAAVDHELVGETEIADLKALRDLERHERQQTR